MDHGGTDCVGPIPISSSSSGHAQRLSHSSGAIPKNCGCHLQPTTNFGIIDKLSIGHNVLKCLAGTNWRVPIVLSTLSCSLTRQLGFLKPTMHQTIHETSNLCISNKYRGSKMPWNFPGLPWCCIRVSPPPQVSFPAFDDHTDLLARQFRAKAGTVKHPSLEKVNAHPGFRPIRETFSSRHAVAVDPFKR